MSTRTDNPLWRLLPGNPIFQRVVSAGSKRTRHALIRIGYLAVLVVVAVLGLVMLKIHQGSTLTELSRSSARLFETVSYVQLGMACLLAPIFTAGAITQEKDNNTYHVLLSTPMSNAQIVLGSLVSRLYFVLALLASGIPIFLITQLYGGVTGRSILLSFMIAAATAVLTGAVAIAIAVLRVGTGKTIFSFYIVISLYIAVLWLAGESGYLTAPYGRVDPATGAAIVPENPTSWVTALHPFLSLKAVLNVAQPPDPVDLAHLNPLQRFWLCRPHYAYLSWTLTVSVLMIIVGTIFLRWTATRTRIDWRRRFKRWITGNRKVRPPRSVWNNPVAWREAATRASAGGKSLMRWVFLVGGIGLGAVMVVLYAAGTVDPTTMREVLKAALFVELTIALLVLCNVSASAITREREDGTLDLLLVTPITSRYYIWGKLRGLISFAAVLLLVPVSTALLFAVVDFLPGRTRPIVSLGGSGLNMAPIPMVPLEAVAELALVMLAFSALTAMIALSMSLKVRRTISAVIWTVLVVGTAGLGASACGAVSVNQIPVLGPMIASLSPFVQISLAVTPHETAARVLDPSGNTSMTPGALRVMLLVETLAAVLIYFAVVWGIYGSMVKNFDMIVRRQSR